MKVKIEFEIEIPEIDATDEELEDFLRFEFNDNGHLSGENPYNKKEVRFSTDPIFGTFDWEIID